MPGLCVKPYCFTFPSDPYKGGKAIEGERKDFLGDRPVCNYTAQMLHRATHQPPPPLTRQTSRVQFNSVLWTLKPGHIEGTFGLQGPGFPYTVLVSDSGDRHARPCVILLTIFGRFVTDF